MKVRAKSQEAWILQRDTDGTQHFDRYIKADLISLRGWQYLNQKFRKFSNGIRKILSNLSARKVLK
jgi:hypothetical protein